MKINKTLFYTLLSSLFIIQGCQNYTSTDKLNFAYKYDPEPTIIRPEFKVFHISESSSNFYFGINSREALYTKIKGDTLFEANLKIRYKLFNQINQRAIIDSSTYIMRDTTRESDLNKILYGGFTLKAEKGNNYYIEVRIRDENRDLNIVDFYTFNKQASISSEHFLLLDSLDYPLLNDRVVAGKPFSIVKSPALDVSSFQLKSYDSPLQIAPPPFAENGISYALPSAPSSAKSINLKEDTSRLFILNEGLHLLSISDTSDRFAFLSANEAFPKLGEVKEMIAPTRFISTQKEYDVLNSNRDTKEAVDNFWLNITKDFNRARKILGTYYGRVESANEYFTDIQEGWKTDRGLIYLIYGPPSTIYKGYNYEKWIYGEESNMLAISFNFRRMENALSRNIYKLDRNTTFKSSWYRAVDNWRQGRVY